jgi:hypothetical protein
MTSSDEGQDRELLQRYRQASDADPRVPSAAVRAAILKEGRRVAASLSAPNTMEPAGRWKSRRKMSAWGAAAAALLAAIIVAPRFWNDTSPTRATAATNAVIPFNQAARKTESAEASPEPHPVVPVMPVPESRDSALPPSASLLAKAPTLRRALPPPPPVLIPEQSVEITPLSHPSPSAAPAPPPQAANLAQAERINPVSNYTQRNSGAATPMLSAAAAAGDLVETTQLLDQGALINEQDAAGRTPLMLAVAQNQIDTVRLLLNRGADPGIPDAHGLSPLQLAQQRKFDDIAALLLNSGAR